MKILSIGPGSGHCADCHNSARFRVEIGRPTLSDRDRDLQRIPRQGYRPPISYMLCRRCTAYLAHTLLRRLDESGQRD